MLGCTAATLHLANVPRPLRCSPGLVGRLSRRRVTVQSHSDRDHPKGRPFDDPHQTPPPHPPGFSTAASSQREQQGRPPSPSGASEFDSFDHPATFDLPSSLSTSDLEFGADAFSGSTLETPAQLAHHYRHPHPQQEGKGGGGGKHEQEERMRQADIAREAAEPRGLDAAARADLEANESTAVERQACHQGILQAIDSLGAHETRGASDNEDERQSPEARRLLASTDSKESEFDALRHTVDELGEGEEAVELIMKSYQRRDLDAEALGTMDPSDSMPHPGDRYLRPPSAARPSQPPPGGMEARLNASNRLPSERRPGPLLPPTRGAASSQGQLHSRCLGGGANASDHSRHSMPSGLPAWMPPGDSPTAARAQHEPVGGLEEEAGGTAQQAQHAQRSSSAAAELESDDQIGLGGPAPGWAGVVGAASSGEGTADDQIDFEQDALRGADAMYYAPEHAANPAVNGFGGGRAGASGNDDAPEVYDIEGDALRGGDAMFYFKASRRGLGGKRGAGEEHPVQCPVWGALASRDDEHSRFRRAMEEAAAVASSHRYAATQKAAQGGRSHRTPPAQVPVPGRAGQAGSTGAGAGQLAMGAHGTVSAAILGGAHSMDWHWHDTGKSEAVGHAGVLASLRRRQEERKEAEEIVQQEVGRLRNSREPRDPKPPAPLSRVVEVVAGRSAGVGLGSAVVTEILTRQSVLSQLLGRFEGSRQVEFPLNMSQSLALAVVVVAVMLTIAEYATGGRASPHWRVLGLSPTAQLWLGRAAMALWAALLTWETIHSNRPAFGTLFYLWF